MSSLSSATVSTSSMTATCPSRPTSLPKYRVAEYYDGKVSRIQESRRRSHVTGLANSPTSCRQQRTSGVHMSPFSTKNSPSVVCLGRSDGNSKDRKLREGLASHVTITTQVSSKAKVTVWQSPMPIRPKGENTFALFQIPGMPTPPPTPKIERLPTPDLDDLDATLFCECCAGTHFFKYCTACGSELHQF